jgi:hypothetical protein
MKNIILALVALSAAASAAPPPEAHCVLCGDDTGGGDGGGGTYAIDITGYLDDNFPGWNGPIDCDVVRDGSGVAIGSECQASFTWHGFPVDAGCTVYYNGQDSGCGSSI